MPQPLGLTLRAFASSTRRIWPRGAAPIIRSVVIILGLNSNCTSKGVSRETLATGFRPSSIQVTPWAGRLLLVFYKLWRFLPLTPATPFLILIALSLCLFAILKANGHSRNVQSPSTSMAGEQNQAPLHWLAKALLHLLRRYPCLDQRNGRLLYCPKRHLGCFVLRLILVTRSVQEVR